MRKASLTGQRQDVRWLDIGGEVGLAIKLYLEGNQGSSGSHIEWPQSYTRSKVTIFKAEILELVHKVWVSTIGNYQKVWRRKERTRMLNAKSSWSSVAQIYCEHGYCGFITFLRDYGLRSKIRSMK